LQSPTTDTCGLFSIFYLWVRCQGYPMKDIVQKIFSSSVDVNEQMMCRFLTYTNQLYE
jgi:hypothetical protein